MTISTLAFGKASASESLRVARLHAKRLYSMAPAASPANGNTSQAKAEKRELFMNVLSANATKRDAKQYLARFKPPKVKDTPTKLSSADEERNARHRRDQDRLDRSGVNLGGLYAPARAIAESPQFTQPGVKEHAAALTRQQLHIALICLTAPETLDDATLDGVATILSQLVKLDMRLVVVLDCGVQGESSMPPDVGAKNIKEVQEVFAQQGERLSQAIARHSVEGARLIDGTIEVQGRRFDGTMVVSLPDLLLDPLKRRVIPILPPLAHTSTGQLVHAPASSILLAVTQLLSDLNEISTAESHSTAFPQTSLDRIIVLDEAGGIPSKARGDDAHVFVNLTQEFQEIESELADYSNTIKRNGDIPDNSNVYEQHRSNLNMLRKCLAILPSASSALIITPQEAASSSKAAASETAEEATIGTGTRRQKNTLIHNLLTNKPMVSSSLPIARLSSASDAIGPQTAMNMPSATLLKRGMPLKIIPGPERGLGWHAPSSGATSLSLENDNGVDLPRLVHLIEDSFRRKLDVQHYLSRIQNTIAGLIIAGKYEGGAILTWEMPPGTSDAARLVPYLDKFAVLSSSQGSSGVADIVFQSMVRTCFPQGVCWRSRKDNPVNKWYFERSDGTWQIPDTNWTMFWTGQGVVDDPQRWEDYVGVCRSVGPSWADGKTPD